MEQFVTLPKLRKGDQVAVISPSSGMPGLFPWVQDLGLERLREVFGLVPKEYASTRQMGSSLDERARDIMAAFADPLNKAVIASIGGDDQIKLLKKLNPEIFTTNPKPFFGFSDNTHLHNYLWNLGIPSYYGGSIMTQYAMQEGMHKLTVEFLQHAFFDTGEFELRSSDFFTDEGLEWSVKENLQKARKIETSEGWSWDGSKNGEGILWGGCVESFVAQFAVGSYLPDVNSLAGTVLFLETAEDIPEPWLVEYVLSGMGERGWFDKLQGVLVGRPKAWEFDKQKSVAEKASYRKEQRETILSVVREYNQNVPVIQNMDFGHTDPQIVLPMGQKVRIDSSAQKIFATY